MSRYVIERTDRGPEGGQTWSVFDTLLRMDVDWCRTKKEARQSVAHLTKCAVTPTAWSSET